MKRYGFEFSVCGPFFSVCTICTSLRLEPLLGVGRRTSEAGCVHAPHKAANDNLPYPRNSSSSVINRDDLLDMV